ncbi:DUF5641 domain-containing protein [Trichonephila inaurata madagascariensis]|uniref:DUF5641 domain-containing protein n=1 Tax=Trichonephila inaurata madagascariensis TaxID=2747483 RepID=A0A8X6XDT3_9ARAC|nr:DUF5641 domain-containing protein [Trichonephila inaurata madagascariensis]
MILLARTGLGSTQRQRIKATAEEPSLATSAALVLSEIKEKGIMVPDFCNSVNEIDMLLGADVISVILSGRTIKLMSDLIAIGTMLGYTLMGILRAATLLPKMWLQETWKVKLAYDSFLPRGLCNKFNKWFKEILLPENAEIPRYCEMNSDSDLHVFVDASKNAYAACIFVRTKLASRIKLHLLRAKARVAPTIKVCQCLGNAVLAYEELLTVLCDCESIVNSRPFTYVSEDLDDLIPLTPEMFMMSNSSLDVTDLVLSDFAKFQKRVKFRARLLKDLRGRFRKGYLGLLVQKAHKTTRALKVGEIVLIENLNKKRLYWPLGKVIELIPGRDGKVRTLKLRYSNSEITHPIQRVFPLEIQSAEMGESNDVPLDAEALKIPSAGIDVSESAVIPVDVPPNIPKMSRYERAIQRPRRQNVFYVTTVFESE